MTKKILFLIAFILCVLPIKVHSGDFYQAVPHYINTDIEELTGNRDFSHMIEQIAKGEVPVEDDLLSKLVNIVFGEVRNCMVYTVSVLGFCIFSSCVKGSQLSLPGSAGEIAFLVCHFIVGGFLLGIMSNAVKIALSASEELSAFIRLSLPAYIGIASSMGINLTWAKSVFMIMINVVSAFAGGFMINAFMYTGILSMISNMSRQIHITKLIAIFRQAMFWVLGFLLTIFTGLGTLSGINASAVTGTGARAIKYTVGRSVPLIGGFLAESGDLIFASAKIFKNAFGTGGIIITFLLCLVPVLKLFVIGFVLKITAGLAEPFCEKRMCDTVYSAGQTVIHIMSALILMTVMFILAFAVILNV